MYGDNYGYRSGLNQSMVRHLARKVTALQRCVGLSRATSCSTSGATTRTLLKAYVLARRDPARRHRPDRPLKFARLLRRPDSSSFPTSSPPSVLRGRCGDAQARIVTSIAMFYDLEAPSSSSARSRGSWRPTAIWHFEQSYMPSMLRMNSYDTICHEHLEYYSLAPVKRMLEAVPASAARRADERASTAAVLRGHRGATPDSRPRGNDAVIEWLLGQEERMGLHTPRPFRSFEERVFEHRANLQRLVRTRSTTTAAACSGYGASTKGNVLLQFCGFGPARPPRDRRGQPGQVRLLHARHRHPDRVGGRGAGDEARLPPGPALALQGRASSRARRTTSRTGGQDDLPAPRDRDRRFVSTPTGTQH